MTSCSNRMLGFGVSQWWLCTHGRVHFDRLILLQLCSRRNNHNPLHVRLNKQRKGKNTSKPDLIQHYRPQMLQVINRMRRSSSHFTAKTCQALHEAQMKHTPNFFQARPGPSRKHGFQVGFDESVPPAIAMKMPDNADAVSEAADSRSV